MKMLVDMFACQTESRFRGIGRYSLSLVRELVALRGENTVLLGVNGLYTDSLEELRQEFTRILPVGSFLPYHHPELGPLEQSQPPFIDLASNLVLQAYQTIAPDSVLYLSVFEGWGEKGVVPLPVKSLPNAKRVAIIYDFIPYIFPDLFLDNNPPYRHRYMQQFTSLKEFDILLSISESTRNDAIQYLKLDPDRVINISAAASPKFAKLTYPEEYAKDLLKRLGIQKKYVFYPGNVDPHKNIDNALQAFQNLPINIRSEFQFVITHTRHEGILRAKAASIGIEESDLIITQHVNENELIALYNLAYLVVFPSLYEGFGLPVLEAMACGVPVIASNTSSIPEVTGTTDNLFNPRQVEDITRVMYRFLTDDKDRDDLIVYGLQRAKLFSWANSAQKAWAAIESIPKRNFNFSMPSAAKKEKVALVLTLVENNEVISSLYLSIYDELKARFEIDLFAVFPVNRMEGLPKSMKLQTLDQLLDHRNQYATAIYVVNDIFMDDKIRNVIDEFPGVVVYQPTSIERNSNTTSTVSSEEFERRRNKLNELGSISARVIFNIKNKSLDTIPFQVARDEFALANDVITLQPTQAGLPAQPPTNAAALPEIVRAAIDTDERQLFSSLIESLSRIESSSDWLLTSAQCAAANLQLRHIPRLIIDVSFINSIDLRSGIQRVVKNIITEFVLSQHSCMPVDLIYIKDEAMVSACRFAERLFQLEEGCLGNEHIVAVKPGDVLFMLDSSFGYYQNFPAIFDQVRRQGGRVISMVYDLIPALFPETTDENNRNIFIPWLNTILRESDHIICISKSVADDVLNYIRQYGINPNRILTLSYFHLGSDLRVINSEAKIRPAVDNLLLTDQQNTFIAVGTIEPRKGISTILDAFDFLWSQGSTHRLCILGKPGWNVDAIIKRIQTHPNIEKLLFFIENPTDAEINACYSFATGLIAASIAEGFGLPLVEAALHKVPTLASDIPPFREIGGEGALFFPADSSVDLANQLIKLSSFTKDERIKMAEKIKLISWKESTEWLKDIIITGKNYQVLTP